MEDWYRINNIDEIDSPALVIYPDRVKKNIALLKSMINDADRLRPHVKTNKAKEACLLLLEAGISKFKCATIAEAEMLGQVKAPDVLLAYQPIGPKVQRFISLIKHYRATKFSCLVDNISSAQEIAKEAINAGIEIPVYVDLNVGMNRTGIIPGQKALELYMQCSQIKGIIPVGLHVYDGHITDPEFDIREKRCNEAFEPVDQLRKELTQKGFSEPVIVAGGTPSFPVHAKREKIQCSPGTFIYWDAGYVQKYKEQSFLPAALVISRIISLPNETTICADLGHKSVASENPLNNRVHLINAPELIVIGQSEEHLVLQTNKDHHYKRGDVLYGMPVHICPTCALYERALIAEDGEVTG
ncbi:MAG TPA: D-TA family PLP-dependent enzyme, partial [Chitinophagaceae bacterium]|nr:D-TA family PLP-dependent enzyme [Chitinophagaceae bacterium]